ncbi:sorting nexin-17 [Onthophagus taurus]|uniref:sorting nexin-17 n=1 Tax=Onthophagus taurus TaxID=166361 RepID=UPI000C20B221|nr:sorting nexin-17 [Onthophagus taurus]
MHFSIPDTQELNDGNGSTYMGYNIHINGVFHCTVRYRQLHNLNEQLKKEFGGDRLPHFPPKKLLPLTDGQLEERRALLEKYIQIIGQDPKLVSCELLVGFLLSAQQETTCEKRHELKLDIYTMNNYQISLNILSTDRTEQVLLKACKHINLPPEFTSYFALYVIRKEENGGDITILRKLQEFESPYISCKSIRESNRLVIRKSYWDSKYDLELMNNPVALNLLYTQTVSDVERGWILTNSDIKNQLAHFQARLAKLEYLELARTLKYYGYTQFNVCFCDYPKPQTKALVAIGGEELNLRLIGHVMGEGSFKVTRMRCWRITAMHNKPNMPSNSSMVSIGPEVELSFEYLMAKEELKWITISSPQSILMSVCLQSVVDELLLKKKGIRRKSIYSCKGPWSYMKRDGSSHTISLDDPDVNTDAVSEETKSSESNTFSIKKLQEKFSSVSFKTGKEFVENHAFEGIGDDDL